MVSAVKIDIPSRATQTEIDALVNIPAGASVFNKTTGKMNISLLGGATPIFQVQDMQAAYDAGASTIVEEDKNISISSFEKSVEAISSLDNPGIGYVAGNVLASAAGTYSEQAKFLVETVDGSGQITQIKIIDEGKYSVAPSSPIDISGGVGDGASINLVFASKNVSSQGSVLSLPGGVSLGRSGAIPSYAIADFGSVMTGDKKCILIGSLTNAEETRLLAKSPVDSVYWYNSDLGRFRTSVSNVAKTILTNDDVPLSAKGDIIARTSTTNVRVPVGTNNQVLMADNTATPGVEWKTLLPVLFSAYRVTSLAVASTATQIAVCNSVTIDNLSAYNVGTGEYTIPAGQGGYYSISISSSCDCAINGNFSTEAFVLVNGVTEIARAMEGNRVASSALTFQNNSASIFPVLLSAGDIVTLRLLNSGDNTINIRRAYLSIMKLPI